ncbi:hypothetical protein OUZ56_014489 [Daphnia magna]|uniref:Uncharacterized protein n=1 Tax=Daphnia magna TaxID=35525 RepID=A0ABR0AK32_9CRUS|nr:hypothetical protein OUZ56_014489 [Daphnia magna]
MYNDILHLHLATVLYNQSHNTLLCYLNGQSRSQQLEPVNSHHTHTPTTSTARNLSTQSPKSPPVPISHLTDSDLGQGLRMKGIHLFPVTSFVKQMWGLIPSLQLPSQSDLDHVSTVKEIVKAEVLDVLEKSSLFAEYKEYHQFPRTRG